VQSLAHHRDRARWCKIGVVGRILLVGMLGAVGAWQLWRLWRGRVEVSGGDDWKPVSCLVSGVITLVLGVVIAVVLG
jgi:hypothetical protein